jgi:hypothetical protein
MIHDIQQLLLFVTHEDYSFGHLPPTATLPGKLLRQPRNLVIIELILSPILFIAGIHSPRVLLRNQGYPKVCPNSLDLLNAGDSFTGISPLTSCYLFSRTRNLIAMFWKNSRVFFVKFPKLSVFQIDELLYFIYFHRKFIKM